MQLPPFTNIITGFRRVKFETGGAHGRVDIAIDSRRNLKLA